MTAFRRAQPLAMTLLGACVALTMATYLLILLAWSTPGYERTGTEGYWFATWPVLFLAYPIVGSLIASRQPGNAVGWLFCVVGLLWAANLWSAAYASYGLKAHPGSLPGAATANWFQSWAFSPASASSSFTHRCSFQPDACLGNDGGSSSGLEQSACCW